MTITTPTVVSTPVAFDAAELKAALTRLRPIVGHNKHTSVLQHLRVDFDGEHAVLTGTDLDSTLQIRLSAPALDAGSFLVPFARLAKVVGAHSKGTITLEGDGSETLIRFDRSTVAAPVDPVAEFPSFAAKEGRKVTLNLGCLADVLPAVSTDDSRPILCSVFVEDGRYVATDSYRMYVVDTPDATTGKFLLPRPAVELAVKGRTGECNAYVSDHDIRIELDENTTLISRLVEGEFPPYRNLIPRNDDVIVELPDSFPADLAKLMKIGIGDKGTPVRVSPAEGGLRVELASTEEKAFTLCGGSTRLELIAWNPIYMASLVEDMSDLRVYGCDALKPSVLRDEAPQLGEGVTRIRLIMPVRVN